MSKPKELAALTEDQQKALVRMAIELGVIQVEEAEVEKPKVLVDKYQLQKLFWNTKFRDPKQYKKMPRLIVRCERAKKVWHVVTKGAGKKPKIHVKDKLVLTNVAFINKTGLETEKRKEFVGCGVTETVEVDVYSGFAEGDLVPMSDESIKTPEESSKLRYDREEGKFYDAITGDEVVEAAYLVLLENCHHAYIPMPKHKKKGK